MNIRDLMLKLDTIAEAEAPVADPARAQYDKFKSDDARSTAIAQVKKMTAPNGNANFIDPKDGVIKYQEQSGEGGAGGIKEFSYDWFKKGQEKQFFDTLKTAGLEIIPVAKKSLFGTFQVAGVEPGKLAEIMADIKPIPPTPGPNPTPGPKGNDDAAKLEALVAQLEKSLSGEGPMPGPGPGPGPHPKVNDMTTGQKLGVGAGIGAGALAGQQLAKKAGFGGVGQTAAGVVGGAVGGLGAKAMQKEGQDSIARALVESFDLTFEDEELDEYSMDQLGKDAGDFGRGAWNGVTLGTGDNIAAGVKSALGPGTYKDELAKQTAASQEAEKRSPWLYGAGNVAGSIAAPIPGGMVAGGLIKGASTAAKLARGATALGTNIAAQAGIDKLKNKADIATLAQGGDQKLAQLQTVIKTVPDGRPGPATQKALAAWQAANGLPATGKADPATYAKAGIAESRTVAEDIKSLQDKLAMIESGQWRLEEDADYRVWLLEDGTVVGEQGEVITNEAILSEVNWGALAGDAWKGVKGVASNFASGVGGKAVQGSAKSGEEIAAMQAARTAAGKKALHPSQITNLGLDKAMPTKAQTMANTIGQKIHMNPGKTALGAAGAIGAGALALGSGGGASATGTTTGGGGTGGGGTGGGTTTPVTSTPGGLSPEQQALIKQIKDLTMAHGEDESPEWLKATGHMQVVLDKAEHASPAQAAADAKNDVPAATNATADTTKGPDMGKVTKPDSGQAASQTGTTIPTQTLTVPKVPAGTTVGKDGVTEPVKEGEEDELARWLRIARG